MKKYILIFFVFIIFTGCFGPASVEEQEETCLAENKNFTSFHVMNYRTGKSERKIICR